MNTHKNTRLNIGHQIKYGNTYLKTSIKRGSIFNIQFDHKLNFLSFKSNANPVEKKDISSFSELQKQLEENNIGLKEVYEDDSSIEVSVRQNIYQNQFEPNEIIRKSLKNLTKNKKEIIISQFSQGMKVSEISYSTNQKKNIRNENYVDYNRGDNV